jgi:NADH:ubiquinone oxidoreductase subunit C
LLPDATVIRGALSAGGVSVAEVEEVSLGLVCHVPAAEAVKALGAIAASSHGFNTLIDMLGIDTGEDVEITYHVRSLARDEELYVKTRVPYGSVLESAWEVYPAVLMPERETAELFGLSLSGHPNPKRLLTTDGVQPLLLKSMDIRSAEEVRAR